jgi:hypothetical protein
VKDIKLKTDFLIVTLFPIVFVIEIIENVLAGSFSNILIAFVVYIFGMVIRKIRGSVYSIYTEIILFLQCGVCVLIIPDLYVTLTTEKLALLRNFWIRRLLLDFPTIYFVLLNLGIVRSPFLNSLDKKYA